MKKIYLLLFLLPLTGAHLFAQKPATGCPKLLYHSSQINDTTCDEAIKNIRAGSSGRIVVKYFERKKSYVPEDSLWGIRPKNESPLRLFNGHYYSLVDLSPVYKYSRRSGKHAKYYFSTGLDSPLYAYTQSQLKKYTDSATYAALVVESRTGRHELSLDLFAANAKLLNNNLWGGGFSAKYYPQKNWSTGLLLSGAGKRTVDTFGFSIRRPVLNYYEIGLLNSFDLVQKNRWRTGISLTNGIAIAELRDKAQTEKVRTRYGYRDVPKRIATNYYYLLEPGVGVSLKLVSNNHNPDFYLTGSARYRLLFGNNRFGTQEVFSGPVFSIGLSLIGFDKEELR